MKMKMTILRIDNRVVTAQLDTGTIIDIARRWFTDDLIEGDCIEMNINFDEMKKNVI